MLLFKRLVSVAAGLVCVALAGAAAAACPTAPTQTAITGANFAASSVSVSSYTSTFQVPFHMDNGWKSDGSGLGALTIDTSCVLEGDIVSIGGTALALGQTTKSASIPVVLPSDQFPLQVVGYDSGMVTATATPANSSHAAGTSIGGLFSVSFFRVSGGSGEVGNLMWISSGGSTGALVVRLWQKNPSGTTCTDNSAYAGSATDDANLIIPPFTITPSAPAVTTGDAKTYATYQFTPPLSATNASSNTTLYACVTTVATDTADQNQAVRLGVSGPQD